MGILEKIGLKKKDEAGKQSAVSSDESTAAKSEIVPRSSVLSQGSRAHEILLKPILSEKATHLATRGKYVFAVHPRANKNEIRKSIQQVYGVHVESVKIVQLKGKTRHYGRSVGQTSNWKKAIIGVRAGEKIPGIIEAVG